MAFADGALIVPAPLTPAQVNTGFSKCGGLGIRMNSQGFNATVRYLETLIAGGPDKFVAGLGGYDATTNVLSLTMSDGSTVPINMTALIADALDDIVPNPDASGTQRGLVNNVALQELGGADKRVNGNDLGRGGTNTVGAAVFGQNAGQANTSATPILALGSFALTQNSGSRAIGLGYFAGYNNSGANATLMGTSSGYSNTGALLVAVGDGAASNNTGSEVTAMGAASMEANTGNLSSGFGAYSGRFATGADSVYAGVQAGERNSGNKATMIGRGAGFANSFIESGSIGYDSQATQDYEYAFGNANTVNARCAGTFSGASFVNISDARNKDNVKDIDGKKAAEFSKRVRYVTYDMMTSFDQITRDKNLQAVKADALIAANKKAEKDNIAATRLYDKEVAAYEKSRLAYNPSSGEPLPVVPIKPQLAIITEIAKSVPIERVKLFEQANVIAQEIQDIAAELGDFGYLVKTSAGGELSIDSVSFNAVVNAGYQHAIFTK